MKKLATLSVLLLLAGCKGSDSAAPTATVVDTRAPYFAEYGVPDQSLIQSCSGNMDLVRPVVKCVKRANNVEVSPTLCYNLDPIFMSIPSPAGERQFPITGGVKLETCEEGSTEVIATATVCHIGYKPFGDLCQSYEASGSYVNQKPQFTKNVGGIKLIYNIGTDQVPLKNENGLKLFLVFE